MHVAYAQMLLLLNTNTMSIVQTACTQNMVKAIMPESYAIVELRLYHAF